MIECFMYFFTVDGFLVSHAAVVPDVEDVHILLIQLFWGIICF